MRGNTKVVVKAVEEKLAMTAEATGVKKITVTFNKAVDTTKAVIAVKKGVATIATTTTFAADAKSAELALGSKITAGTYTVTVTGLEDALSADVVTKDETLTSFELVGKNLVASSEGTTDASISYKALNQYGEMMAPNNVNVSSTFSTAANTDNVTPTATKAGTITCKDIIQTLAIPGTVGTIVIVDTQTGVNLNEQVTYQSKAVPASATVVGIYDDKTEKLIDGNLKKGDDETRYYIMLNIKDQYDTEMTAKAASNAGVSLNPAPILTDLTTEANLDASTSGNAKDISYNNANNVLVAFKDITNSKISKAGTLNLTIVSANKGVLATPVITVEEPTTVTSISVAAATQINAGQKNDLIVEAYDSNGAAVTSYDALKAAQIDMQSPITGATVTLEKNSDGTGKFVYDVPANAVSHVSGDKKYRNSLPSTLTIYANAAGSGNYLVKTANVTIFEQARLWEVTGKTKDTVTAASSGTSLVVDLSTLTYADQYGNAIKWKDIAGGITTADAISYLVTGSGVFSRPSSYANGTVYGSVSTAGALDDGKKITLKAGSAKGTDALYIRVQNDGDGDPVSADKYDLKLDLSVVNGQSIDVSDIEIASVNDGKTVYAATSGSIVLTGASAAASVGSGSAVYGTEVPVVVTATVNNKKVILDPSQYTITNPTVAGIATQAGVARQTVKKTVNVVVESENGALEVSKEFEISNEDAKVVEIKASDNGTSVTGVTTDTALTANSLGATFKFVTQYGENVTATEKANALYYVTFTGDKTGSDYYTLTGDKTQKINVAFKIAGTYTAKVKAVIGDASFEQDVTIKVADHS